MLTRQNLASPATRARSCENVRVLELQLPEQTASKLQEAAERLSLSPEQLSILSIEEKIAQLEDEFRRSVEYVIQKNADLYRRLS